MTLRDDGSRTPPSNTTNDLPVTLLRKALVSIDRAHVRPVQRLEPCGNEKGPMPKGIPLCNHFRRAYHVLAMTSKPQQIGLESDVGAFAAMDFQQSWASNFDRQNSLRGTKRR